MGIRIMAEVWEYAQVDQGELLFLLALANRASDDQRVAWPGVRELARRTRRQERQVYRYAAALEGRYIERVTDEEIHEYGLRYVGRSGHQTVTWRIRPVSEWPVGEGWGVTGDIPQTEEWGVTGDRGGVSPVTAEPSENNNYQERNSPATQGSLSLRRARRGRTKPTPDPSSPSATGVVSTPDRGEDLMADPVDALFAVNRDEETDPPRSARPRNASPDSSWGLNKYYRDALFLANGRVGDHNDRALMKWFSDAKRAGLSPETLRTMIDLFADDPGLLDNSRARWTVFIGSARMLQNRAEQQISTPADGVDEGDVLSGVPQRVLDTLPAEGTV